MGWRASYIAIAGFFTIICSTYPASYARGFTCFQLPCRFEENLLHLENSLIHTRQLPFQRRRRTFYSSSLQSAPKPNGEILKETYLPRGNTKRQQPLRKIMSYISSIRSHNLAGITGHEDEKEIVLNFEAQNEDGSNLVVVTGETGSGKSLLVSKVAELVTGGKATVSLLDAPKGISVEPRATVEMVLKLYDDSHASMVKSTLERMKLDPTSILLSTQSDPPLTLKLKRSLSISKPTGRIKSTCSINDHEVTLKVLKAVGAPLLAIVNAPAAAATLGRPKSRMAMIDTGVPSVVLSWVRQLQANYNKRRRHREKLEKELESRTLPVSMNLNGDDDKDLELLRHWIEELDGFEARISNVCQSISLSALVGGSSLAIVMEEFDGLTWMDNEGNTGFNSGMHRRLLDLSDHLRSMDEKIEAAMKARDALASLSLPDSAKTALERTRQLLLDAAAGEEMTEDENNVSVASERAHQLLNHVEDALSECANFLDNGEKGLLAILQTERNACSLSSEDVLVYITEWGVLARKHGISPYVLPSCHASLRQELDGNVEARTLLPMAIKAETKALEELEEGCAVLSQARKELSKRISKSISRRLPLLGMENSRFEARLQSIEKPTYASALGVDEVDFLLFHGSSNWSSKTDNERSSLAEINGASQPLASASSQRGGKVDLVASSGEKARILLAIECEIPGSVRALGCGTATGNGNESDDEELNQRPVAVIYDEIDAHVGGRASVSVAQMLSDQSQSCQVVSITHSPSVAAIADLHVCIQKQPPSDDGRTVVSANLVEGLSRRKELARMASGDMATEEAEVFAEALIRDATIKAKKARLQPEM